jgi:cell division protein FtsN
MGSSLWDLGSVVNWINAQHLTQDLASPNVAPHPKTALLPKPKLEFYTLLANENSNGVQPVAVMPTSAPAPATPRVANASVPPATPMEVRALNPIVAKQGYWVQVGSFRSQKEAEKIKASLTLKGFMVSMTVISQQNTSWYRVGIGPFASFMDAEKAQSSVARTEHVKGMIRKMDA